MLALSVSAVSAAQQHPEDSLPALWDLQKCLDHAVQNNISIRQSRLDTESAETDLKTAKAALFPSLFFSTGHSLINRPFQDSGTTVSGTEIISSDAGTSYTGNYGLDASWTLYNGGENRKNTRLQELECEISRLDTEETVKTIEEEIIQLYIQILYSSEAVAICRNTLDVSLAQVERGKELYEEGTLSKADLSQLQAQASSDRYNLVSSETTLQDYRLQLKQMLELDGDVLMELAMPEIPDEAVLSIIPDKASVYASALESRPEVLSGKLDVDAAELNIAISKAGYLLKPVSYPEFLQTVEKAAKWFSRREARQDSIFVKSDYRLVQIKFSDILYIEGLRDYLKIHLAHETSPVLTLMSMKSMEAGLPSDKFIRVHKSFIINKTWIEAVDRGRIVIGKTSIPVGDNYKANFQKSIGIDG